MGGISTSQLGHENEEGLRSGAFWFYQKRMRQQRGHRSSRAMLRKLSSAFAFWPFERGRHDVLGAIALSNLAQQVSRFLSDQYGADRRRGLAGCLVEAAARVGLRSSDLGRLSRPERQAWERWAPLIAALPGGVEGCRKTRSLRTGAGEGWPL